MRAVFNIGLKRYLPDGSEDAHGNAVPGYGPAVDLPVYGIAPYGSTEPTPDRDETDTRVEIYCPPDTQISPRDVLIDVDKTYEVIGVVSDFTRGPYGARFGVVYVARRVEG